MKRIRGGRWAWAALVGAAACLSSACEGERTQPVEDKLALDPAHLVLPEAWVGHEVFGRLELTNVGGTAVTLSDVSVTGEGFSLAHPVPDRLPVGGRVSLEVRFKPTSAGSATGRVRVARTGEHLEARLEATAREPPECDDANPCTDDAFEPRLGRCIHTQRAGTCDDGSACTKEDRCVSGACIGTAITCDDGLACTLDGCDSALGCVFQVDDAQCDDGNPCTVAQCLPSQGCVQVPAAEGGSCGEVEACALHVCRAGACVREALTDGIACDDGDGCTVADACASGACLGRARNCDDGNVCTVDACEDGTCTWPPAEEGLACDDGTACTDHDVCRSGVCRGVARSCRDSDPCTVDTCLPELGCRHAPAQEGAACDPGDRCIAQAVCRFGRCEATAWAPDGAACDDGDLCSVRDVCEGGACVGESLVGPLALASWLPTWSSSAGSTALREDGRRISVDLGRVLLVEQVDGVWRATRWADTGDRFSSPQALEGDLTAALADGDTVVLFEFSEAGYRRVGEVVLPFGGSWLEAQGDVVLAIRRYGPRAVAVVDVADPRQPRVSAHREVGWHTWATDWDRGRLLTAEGAGLRTWSFPDLAPGPALDVCPSPGSAAYGLAYSGDWAVVSCQDDEAVEGFVTPWMVAIDLATFDTHLLRTTTRPADMDFLDADTLHYVTYREGPCDARYCHYETCDRTVEEGVIDVRTGLEVEAPPAPTPPPEEVRLGADFVGRPLWHEGTLLDAYIGRGRAWPRSEPWRRYDTSHWPDLAFTGRDHPSPGGFLRLPSEGGHRYWGDAHLPMEWEEICRCGCPSFPRDPKATLYDAATFTTEERAFHTDYTGVSLRGEGGPLFAVHRLAPLPGPTAPWDRERSPWTTFYAVGSGGQAYLEQRDCDPFAVAGIHPDQDLVVLDLHCAEGDVLVLMDTAVPERPGVLGEAPGWPEPRTGAFGGDRIALLGGGTLEVLEVDRQGGFGMTRAASVGVPETARLLLFDGRRALLSSEREGPPGAGLLQLVDFGVEPPAVSELMTRERMEAAEQTPDGVVVSSSSGLGVLTPACP